MITPLLLTCLLVVWTCLVASQPLSYEQQLRSVEVYRELKHHTPVSVKNAHHSSSRIYLDIRSVKMAAYYEARSVLDERVAARIREEVSAEQAERYQSTRPIEYITKTNRMQNIVDDPLISTVCEIGFNGGYTALNYLIANPTASVLSFDLSSNVYTPFVSRALQSMFPNRSITVISGDPSLSARDYLYSLQTAGEIAGQPLCDLIYVSGAESADTLRETLTDIRKLANFRERDRAENKMTDAILEHTISARAVRGAQLNLSSIVRSTAALRAINRPSAHADETQGGRPKRFTNVLVVDGLCDHSCPLRAVFNEMVTLGGIELLQQVPVYPTPCFNWRQGQQQVIDANGETIFYQFMLFHFTVQDSNPSCQVPWSTDKGWFVVARYI